MEDNNKPKKDMYFAARDAKDAATILLEKSSSFYDHLKSNAYRL
jgi:hypothetical protein